MTGGSSAFGAQPAAAPAAGGFGAPSAFGAQSAGNSSAFGTKPAAPAAVGGFGAPLAFGAPSLQFCLHLGLLLQGRTAKFGTRKFLLSTGNIIPAKTIHNRFRRF